MNAGGIVLLLAGVFVLAQVTKGDALHKLGIIGAGDNGPGAAALGAAAGSAAAAAAATATAGTDPYGGARPPADRLR